MPTKKSPAKKNRGELSEKDANSVAGGFEPNGPTGVESPRDPQSGLPTGQRL
jgi:hypothetical protein